ncbi:2-hydroxyglutaryl-CoA dehydratase [Paracoccus sp. YIM 132242]|uniref:2-hydroxyglutaryl-CoA dehydratase n=1 Tax=Paracoccus lichenicola TaxID=2665644 RepID=A0A6L6HR39_9RHOB|nr:acyl-CoA dehydratase activase [Paracoccus lichenicola]MTE01646.1 2-hydroxyglutaryl-CoA dehydratase [Paracoccus lichenicola]
MKRYVMGIDFGSTTAKTVILDLKGKRVAHAVAHMGAVSGDGVKASIKMALDQAGLTQADMGRTVSTGYGRRMLDMADKNYTEITCHARGAVAMVPGARLVIDIGGQDSKVIAVDDNGLVAQFAMNDRCAAGTGKFLEVLARAVEVDLDKLGELALGAREKLKISSMCATFAETEVISLLAEGHPKTDVMGAVHAAIAARTLGLVGRVGKKGPVVMTGGVARNPAAVHYIEQALDMPLILPELPQIAGALGAALIGLDDYRAEYKHQITEAEDMAREEQMAEDKACIPGCRGVPELAVDPREKQPAPRAGGLKSLLSTLQNNL